MSGRRPRGGAASMASTPDKPSRDSSRQEGAGEGDHQAPARWWTGKIQRPVDVGRGGRKPAPVDLCSRAARGASRHPTAGRDYGRGVLERSRDPGAGGMRGVESGDAGSPAANSAHRIAACERELVTSTAVFPRSVELRAQRPTGTADGASPPRSPQSGWCADGRFRASCRRITSTVGGPVVRRGR
jgi:hypothetical protein